MPFWDTSAIVPLCVDQTTTSKVRRILTGEPRIVVWWGTPVEVQSALGRLGREGSLSAAGLTNSTKRLGLLRRSWHEVLPTEQVRGLAEELPARATVTAADAFQLAAALVWSRGRPRGRVFVCIDRRLAGVAAQTGFSIVP